MAAPRGSISDFELANPIYVGARVTFYTVDISGNKTTTKATLYSAPTGTTELANPQTLDSDGKFAQPVYTDVAVIADIENANGVVDHGTGIIYPRAVSFRVDSSTRKLQYSFDGGTTWFDTGSYIFRARGAWAEVAYELLDVVTSGGITYFCNDPHTGSGSINLSKFTPVIDSTGFSGFISIQRFSGDGATVNPTFTLSRSTTAAKCMIDVAGSPQVPTTNYTISGTTLTLIGTAPLGTNNILVIDFGALV